MDKIIETLTHPALIVAALVIGTLGEVMKRMINPVAGQRGWRGFYYVTMPMHPVTIGALVGLIPGLPTSTAFAGHLAGRVLFYAGSGVLAQIGYEIMVSTIKRTLEHRGARDVRDVVAEAPPVVQDAVVAASVVLADNKKAPTDDAGPGMGS